MKLNWYLSSALNENLDFNEEYGVRISEESREREKFIANREKALAERQEKAIHMIEVAIILCMTRTENR